MQEYKASRKYIPNEVLMSNLTNFLSHPGACTFFDVHTRTVEYPFRKAASIFLEKNITGYYIVSEFHPSIPGIKAASIQFSHGGDYSGLSHDNKAILHQFKKENEDVIIRTPKESLDEKTDTKNNAYFRYIVNMKLNPNTTVGDVKKFYENLAVQMTVQPSIVGQTTHPISTKYDFIMELLEEDINCTPFKIFDWKSGITFNNRKCYDMYVRGKDKRQIEKEKRYLEEIQDDHELMNYLKDLTKQCIKRATSNEDNFRMIIPAFKQN